MTTENILQFVQPAREPISSRLTSWLIKRQKADILKNSGLHITLPEHCMYSPLTGADSIRLWALEGFRKGRCVNSTAFRNAGILLFTSIACDIPVFLCSIRNGASRVIKSPVSLPLCIIRAAGTLELVSDGTTLFSKRTHLSAGKNSILRRQLKDVCLLESIIASI